MRNFIQNFVLLALLYTINFNSFAQTTVFNDNFNTSAGTNFDSSNGWLGNSSVWSQLRSGNDFGAKIDAGMLTLTNDASSASNDSGWTLVSTNTNTFLSPYNSVLGSCTGAVSWSFNMRQIMSDPKGFSDNSFGVAFILAGTADTSNSTGSGYAIVLGNNTKIDPIKLVRYTSGIKNQTTLITSNTSGLTDFGAQYLSIKVAFSPLTSNWELYVRNDGSSTFTDPSTGSLTFQGAASNNTYTSLNLQIIGAFWNGKKDSNKTAFFDHIKVAVIEPTISLISPSSKVAGSGAFTLTVNGSNFVNGQNTITWNGVNKVTSFNSSTQLMAVIPATDVTLAGTVNVAVKTGNVVSASLPFTIDLPLVPSLSVSTNSLSLPPGVEGVASAALSYTISGTNLTSDAMVTAPSNFEVSLNGLTYFSSVALARSGNALLGQPVVIYSRVKNNAPAGIYSAAIINSIAGGLSKAVNVNATVYAPEPTVQSSAVHFTNITSTSFTVNWTNGNGTNRLVLIKSASAVNAYPADGNSYVAANNFGNGSELGTGNYVIYAGSGTTITVNSLNPASVYHISIFEYKGANGTANYLTTNAPAANRITLNAPQGLQIYAVNTLNVVDFDSTVDGVTTGAFLGDGLSPGSVLGELNSNAWAISGFSDGAVNFGGSSIADTVFEHGDATGDVVEGGIYAFETSSNNYSLGVQPAIADFNPGAITMKMQNQTAAVITSLNIGYKVYVYNDQAASSSFNFAYSSNNSTYTTVPNIDVISPTTADANPAWKAQYRVTTITGLSISANSYFYLRWTGATVSGSVSFDEFALDDISVVANPTTNFSSIEGTADSFIVNGNAALEGPLEIEGTLSLTNGNLLLGNHNLTLGNSAVNGAFSASKMIVANGSGEVRRLFKTTGSYLFPIGENTGTAEYTPITVTLNTGTLSNAYIGVSVVDAVHPNNYSSGNNISRYWKINQFGITNGLVNILANYTAADLTGAEQAISAAQLKGTFNQITNPWTKLSPLNASTLSASNILLTAGTTSYFTGIKGAAFSNVISGQGIFCQNSTVTLATTVSGGDAPFSYLWSIGLGTTAAINASTAAAGTFNYTATVKDANGLSASSTAAVTVSSSAIGGNILGGTTVCKGNNSTVLTLAGYTGTIQWQSATDNLNFSNIAGATSAAFTANNLNVTTFFRAVLSTSCSSAFSIVATVSVSPPSVGGAVLGSTSLSTSINSTVLTLIGYTGSVQWQSSTDNINFTSIQGATSSTYTVNNIDSTRYYRALVTSGSCTLAYSSTASINVNMISVGGVVQGSSTVCDNAQPNNLTLIGQSGTVLRWEKAATLDFNAPIVINNTSTILTAAIMGTIASTTYFRAVVQSGPSAIAYSSTATIEVLVTSWNGSVWSNGAPTSLHAVTIAGNLVIAAPFAACKLTVTNNAEVTVLEGVDVTLNGIITVESGSKFILSNSASLLQNTNEQNIGSITVKRATNLLKRLDYILWSSPVTAQNLLAFSPSTTAERFYNYNNNTNTFSAVAPASNVFVTGKGYLIRLPNNHPSVPTVWTGSFNGVPQNGTIIVPLDNDGIGKQFNLIGNPYPSALNVDEFIAANNSSITGTLYFWRKTNGATIPTYCTLNSLGFVANGDVNALNPNGEIAVGQGFFVEAKDSATQITFSNTMRQPVGTAQFFRTVNVEQNRIWLNAKSALGAFSQTLLGYLPDATQDVDAGIDGKFINDGEIAIASLIDAAPFAIQGRSLPFDASDIVSLRFKTTTAGNFSIGIDHLDGLFAEDQAILLYDQLLDSMHDLKSEDYNFYSESGIFDSRFSLRFALPSSLGVSTLIKDKNFVVFMDKVNSINIVNTDLLKINEVVLFNIAGQQVQSWKVQDVNQAELIFPCQKLSSGIYIVTLKCGREDFSKKVIVNALGLIKNVEVANSQLAEEE